MKNVVKFENSLELAAIKFSKALNEAFRKFHKEFNLEISHEEFTILEIINTHPGIIPIEIARIVMIQRSYICKTLTKLKNLGYITQENGIRGKKQVIIKNYLTQKGIDEHNKIFTIMYEKYLERSSKESREDTPVLIDKLNKMTARIIEETKIKF